MTMIVIFLLNSFHVDFTGSIMSQPQIEHNENTMNLSSIIQDTISTSIPPTQVKCKSPKFFDHTGKTNECLNSSSDFEKMFNPPSGNKTSDPPATNSSEVENMNTGSYIGGQEVDQLGPGNFNEKLKTREEAVREREEATKNMSSTSSELKQNDDALSKHNSMPASPRRRIESTTAGAVAAGICVVLAVAGYAGLLIWRKISRVQYGNREELINDDDLGDMNESDLHHFEGSSIQIDN